MQTFALSVWLSASCLLLACEAGDPVRPTKPAAEDTGLGAGVNTSEPRADAGSRGAGVPAGEVGRGMGPVEPPFSISSRALVQWKRYAAMEADLMSALSLTREQLCVELGGKQCVRDVHLVPLGGNEPYESGLMKPSAEPLATTASVVDRVLLSACSMRAHLDAGAAPKVFTELDLNAPLPSPSAPAVAATVRDLYRRLLARDPTPREIELVAGLAEPSAEAALSTEEFASLACFTIGSTIEFLFF